MSWLYGGGALAGFCLATWARVSLPDGTVDYPVPVQARVSRGPYRWLTHPMYLGTLVMVMGCAGLAAGWWNVVAVGTVTELLFREWAWRERQP